MGMVVGGMWEGGKAERQRLRSSMTSQRVQGRGERGIGIGRSEARREYGVLF